jgi:hypothetical protein
MHRVLQECHPPSAPEPYRLVEAYDVFFPVLFAS